MQIAWRDCLSWSLRSKNPDFLAAFTDDTGLTFPAPAKTVLERTIDEATGMWPDLIEKYVVWFNEAVWGKHEEGD